MNGFDDFDLFISCEEYYDDAAEFEAKYADEDYSWMDECYLDAVDTDSF